MLLFRRGRLPAGRLSGLLAGRLRLRVRPGRNGRPGHRGWLTSSGPVGEKIGPDGTEDGSDLFGQGLVGNEWPG